MHTSAESLPYVSCRLAFHIGHGRVEGETDGSKDLEEVLPAERNSLSAGDYASIGSLFSCRVAFEKGSKLTMRWRRISRRSIQLTAIADDPQKLRTESP